MIGPDKRKAIVILHEEGKTHLIPAEAFEQEKPYLIALPPYIEPPYRVHKRGVACPV